MQITFENPDMVWFLLGLPILIVTHFLTLKMKRAVALKFSNFELLIKSAPASIVSRAYAGSLMGKDISILFLRFCTLTALILAVAGTTLFYQGKTTDFDYVIALDTSDSMNADDLVPTRFIAAQNAIINFVDTVPFLTNIGLVSFAGTTNIQNELTPDKETIKNTVEHLNTSAFGGTDLGGAIVAGTNILTRSKKHKSIILFTDGQTNIGMPLLDALNFANREGATVHAIGIGTRDGGKIPGVNASFVLDDSLLQRISNYTSGKYFRASDAETLRTAYETIATVKISRINLPLAPYLMVIALILLFAEWGIVNIKYRTVP